MKTKKCIPNINYPSYPKPSYPQVCKGKYSQSLPFQSIQISFWKSPSKNYKNATFICSQIPLHELASEQNNFCNTLIISSEKEFHIYYDAIYKLFMLILNWKYVEFYVNEEICYSDEFSTFIYYSKPISFDNIRKYDIDTELKVFNCKWKEEKNLYYIVKNLFSLETVFFHYHTKWLGRLELDIFVEEYNLAFEYQGIQHYKPMPHWGGQEGLVKRLQNDVKKKNLCNEHNIEIIYFDYTEEVTETTVLNKILKILSKRGI